MLTLPQMTTLASTFLAFSVRRMTENGDSQYGWPGPSRVMNNNRSAASSVKVLTTLSEIAPKQKMY